MKPSITVTEEKIDNQFLDKIKITGASDHQEALEAAEKWCDENNCVLVTKEFDDPIREMENTFMIFYAKVTLDDYD